MGQAKLLFFHLLIFFFRFITRIIELVSILHFESLYKRMQSFVQNNLFFCTEEINLLYKNKMKFGLII
jgi:hypothetical protein